MINLLPSQDKQDLKREVIFRKIFAIFSLHFICLLVLALILGLLSTFLAARVNYFQETAVQKAQQLQTERFQALKDETIFLNSNLSKLQIFWQSQIPVSVFLERFIPLISQEFYIRTLSFNLSSKKIASAKSASTELGASASATSTDPKQLIFADIHIAGVIDSREHLYEFKKVLERQNDFQDIYFSPYSWAKSQYPEFSLNLSFVPANKQ